MRAIKLLAQTMTKWWKIICLDCGINCDLLIDKNNRVICRECLEKNEFNEVENEIDAASDDSYENQISDMGPAIYE